MQLSERADTYLQFGEAGVIPQRLQLQAQVTKTSQIHVTIRESALFPHKKIINI
jgi:hypothetical protein